MEIALSSGLF